MSIPLKQELEADLFRIDARQGWGAFCSTLFSVPTFRFVVLMRVCGKFRQVPWLRWSLYPFLLFWFSHLGRRLGIRIPLDCSVGKGLLIEHWGGIWVNPETRIGRNCNIAHNVTLGWVGEGANRGAPMIGDGVFLGPGSAVLGRVTVGDNALVSANSVVLQDVPENAVVMGVPSRVFSTKGSLDIVKNRCED